MYVPMQFFLHYVLEFPAGMAEVQSSSSIKYVVDVHLMVCDISIILVLRNVPRCIVDCTLVFAHTYTSLALLRITTCNNVKSPATFC